MEHGGQLAARRDPSNATLLNACRAGNPSAWNSLVDRYERLVYAIPLREGLDEDDAADVTQETFTALLHNLDSIVDPERIAHWLMTVARRTTWRWRSGRARQRSAMTNVDVLAVDDHSDAMLDALAVHEAVLSLEEPCRSLVLALFFDPHEPSYAQIAMRLDRPVGSIGPLRGRCIGRLRSELERVGV